MPVFRGRVRKQFIWKYGLREIDGPVLNDHIVWKVETPGSVWNPEDRRSRRLLEAISAGTGDRKRWSIHGKVLQQLE